MAKLKEIKVGLGLALEIKGTWYKPNIELSLEMNEEDTGAKRKEIFAHAWKMASEQVEKQIEEIVSK